MFASNVFTIMIASPSDTAVEREKTQSAIYQWNADMLSYRRGAAIILPYMWEFGAPNLRKGSDSQASLNWMVDRADSLVAFLNSRIGTVTKRASSGTVEEIDRALDRGIPVHLFVSNSPLPRGVETSQIERLREVEEKYRRLGIVGSYNDPEDLTGKLRTVFESDISDIQEPFRRTMEDNRIICTLTTNSVPPTVEVNNSGGEEVLLKRLTIFRKDGSTTPVLNRDGVVVGNVPRKFPVFSASRNDLSGISVEVVWEVFGETYRQVVHPRRNS